MKEYMVYDGNLYKLVQANVPFISIDRKEDIPYEFEASKAMMEKGCEDCRYWLLTEDDDPCRDCSHSHLELWEPQVSQKHDGCVNCKYESRTDKEYPCSYCKQNYKDQWENANE